MEVILLEKIRNLGNIGDKVKVKSGFGRNYLLPEGKAVSATKSNIEKFSKLREELEAKAAEVFKEAQKRAESLASLVITIFAKASDEGKLFGSVGVSSIVQAMKKQNIPVKKSEINMPQGPIRQLGEYDVTLLLHSDVSVVIKVKVAAEEAP